VNLLVGGTGPTGCRPRRLRAGVSWETGWLTVNVRTGRQFRAGKTVGSSPFPCGWEASARRLDPQLLLWVHGIANDWVTVGSRHRLGLLAGLNVQSGHRKWVS